MDNLYIILALALGISIGYILKMLMAKNNAIPKSQYDALLDEKNNLSYESQNLKQQTESLRQELEEQKTGLQAQLEKNAELREQLSSTETKLHNFQEQFERVEKSSVELQEKSQQLQQEINQLNTSKSRLEAKLNATSEANENLKEKNIQLEEQYRKDQTELQHARSKITEFSEQNKHLKEKLDTQKQDLEDLGKQFKDQFRVLADNILEEKSKKFTEQNQTGLKNILDPLGKNIEDFRKKVEETYDKESKERFSLNDRIKELMELNNKISEEASNLTNALKSDTKKQGNWGEMILETILENSGLRKNEEYFVQTTLRTEDGQTIKDDQGHRMQPDVIIKYPDKRNVIIDSKVSLVAYDRYVNAADTVQQANALKEHIQSIRNHVDNLSSKNYQNYTESLDFVMLFIPIEPAYLLAIKEDDTLWNYAYNKRILLISPTNLIAALKLLEDLWKREYQNQNAMDIAERGGKLYDKFVNLIESLQSIGKHIDATNKSYEQAMKQLSTGSGNLIRQVEELNKLGVKAQKQLPNNLLELE